MINEITYFKMLNKLTDIINEIKTLQVDLENNYTDNIDFILKIYDNIGEK